MNGITLQIRFSRAYRVGLITLAWLATALAPLRTVAAKEIFVDQQIGHDLSAHECFDNGISPHGACSFTVEDSQFLRNEMAVGNDFLTETLFRRCAIGYSAQRSAANASSRDDLAWRVSPLPADNLVKNPWFRSGRKPSLEHWISDAYWTASNKQGNPTQDDVEGTSARISTGRTAERRGKTVDPGVETCLYQVVAAEPSHRTLKFDMYWVTHTVNPVVVTVYGGPSSEGPWTEVWKPFYQVQTKSVMPKSGSRRGQDLWKDYSDRTELVTTTLNLGHPYYKVEIRATLPDSYGGLKITGIYFAVVASTNRDDND